MLLLPPFAAGGSAGSPHTAPASRAERPPGQRRQNPGTYQAAPSHPDTRDTRTAEAKPKSFVAWADEARGNKMQWVSGEQPGTGASPRAQTRKCILMLYKGGLYSKAPFETDLVRKG